MGNDARGDLHTIPLHMMSLFQRLSKSSSVIPTTLIAARRGSWRTKYPGQVMI